jgi:prolyl oligopeptidase
VLEKHPRFEAMRSRFLEILDSRDRIPAGHAAAARMLYNLWQDAANPRGLWRRTTLAEYRTASRRGRRCSTWTRWAAAEKENWVWGGATCLARATGAAWCAVARRRRRQGGARVRPAPSLRADGGFKLPEAKTDVDWVDADTMMVGTDTGPGSMTDSGYPRTVGAGSAARRWPMRRPCSRAWRRT